MTDEYVGIQMEAGTKQKERNRPTNLVDRKYIFRGACFESQAGNWLSLLKHFLVSTLTSCSVSPEFGTLW